MAGKTETEEEPKANKPKIDEITGIETTAHEWDGIRELNNPLPRWWLYVFYACILWAIGYWILMPAWPGISSYTKGLLEHSDRANAKADLSILKQGRTDRAAKIAAADMDEIQQDPDLLQFTLEMGRSAFGDNCATCHGTGAQGSEGYPNLNDDVWIWGGRLEDIEQTITTGIRNENQNSRYSLMPYFGRDELLSRQEIIDVAEYAWSLSQSADGINSANAKSNAGILKRGRKIFAAQCASCHGAKGLGDRNQGAPNLTDRDVLYGSSKEAIWQQIRNPRHGAMPAWAKRLDPQTIKALAVYVHALGGGEATSTRIRNNGTNDAKQGDAKQGDAKQGGAKQGGNE